MEGVFRERTAEEECELKEMKGNEMKRGQKE
jgi:hypothetical protein